MTQEQHTILRKIQQALGTADGLKFRLHQVEGQLPLAAAHACMESHWKRLRKNESTPDDADVYGEAFLKAALEPLE